MYVLPFAACVLATGVFTLKIHFIYTEVDSAVSKLLWICEAKLAEREQQFMERLAAWQYWLVEEMVLTLVQNTKLAASWHTMHSVFWCCFGCLQGEEMMDDCCWMLHGLNAEGTICTKDNYQAHSSLRDSPPVGLSWKEGTFHTTLGHMEKRNSWPFECLYTFVR